MTPKERAAMQQALEALVVAEEFVDRHSEDWYISGQQDLKQIREAITALREALAEQAEQEPVAWRWKNGNEWLNKYTYLDNGAPDCPELCEPLYAAPVRPKDPCNPLQDLTDDEILQAYINTPYANLIQSVRAVIAAFKEKNK